jgi:hypothetical protein
LIYSRTAGSRLSTLANEKFGSDSKEQLIFPKKIQKEETKQNH